MNKLYKALQIFTLLTGFAAIAAPTPEKHPVDNFQIGVPSSSAQKQFIFDLGLGASNPNLGVDTALQGLNYSKDLIQFGNGSATNKTFTANIGSGSTNPKIIWDNTNSTWAFSNDGTNFSSFGSGSGGASGIQLLTNGDFESGITLGWTNTGGTFSAVSSGANLLVGKKSATFTASASGQSVQSSLYTVPNGLTGQGCAASMMYKGGDNGLTFQVLDNSANILASQVIETSTAARIISLPFQCPGSGSIRVKVLSSASAALIAMDQMFLGQNTLIATSQANYMGGVLFTQATNCNWQTSTSGTWEVFSNDTDCTTPIIYGQGVSYGKRPGISFANLPPGEYLVTAVSQIQSDAGTSQCYWSLGDAVGGRSASVSMPAGFTGPLNLSGRFSYTAAQSSVTFQMQAWHDGSGTGDPCDLNLSNLGAAQNQAAFEMHVYRFPDQSEQAVRPELINWNVELIQSNANMDLGTSGSLGQYVLDGTNALATTNYGTIQALEPCSGVGSPVSSSCGGGTFPQAGVVFSPPATGKVNVCANFMVEGQAGGGTSSIYNSFQIFQTSATNESTTVATGPNLQGTSLVDPSSGELHADNVSICSEFNITSTAQTAFRLHNNYVGSGATATRNVVAASTGAGGNQTRVYWTVRPVTQNVPAPVIVYPATGFAVARAAATGNGSSSPLAWDTVEYDTHGTFNIGTSKYIIPVSGYYNVWLNLSMSDAFSYGETTFIRADIVKNGSTEVTGNINSTSLNHGTGVSMSKTQFFTVGEDIEISFSSVCSTDSTCHWAPAQFGAQLLH